MEESLAITHSNRKNGNVSTIWCYGNRNPQGLAFSKEGVLWESEHGPRGEMN